MAGVRLSWLVLPACTALLLGGCTSIGQYSNATTNVPLEARSGEPPRVTFQVDGTQLGNPRVLMYLALSGGGSRAAYLSAATMHALELPGIDLLGQVDAIAGVSGGSLAAAYYAASRDAELDDPALAAQLAALPGRPEALSLSPAGRIGCSGALEPAFLGRAATALTPRDMQRVRELCQAADYPRWERKATLDTMKKNFIRRWFVDLLKPQNLGRYWFSSFDRSDIMARTLANSALARPGFGNLLADEIRLGELNPLRPYLLISATNATRQVAADGRQGEFPFGSMFTFTDEDFGERLGSDVSKYSLARAVMASSAFPIAFATMTLENYKGRMPGSEPVANPQRRFLHLIDGGNSDNLGLRAVKRSLLELKAAGRLDHYDRIVVLLVDAFATPPGAQDHVPDPRGLLDLVFDTNVTHAVDSLLQANRDRLLDDFDRGRLHYGRECELVRNAVRHFPRTLCDRLPAPEGAPDDPERYVLGLEDRLVFFHFGFADVGTDERARALKAGLDRIPTSLSIDDTINEPVPSFFFDGYAQPTPRASDTDLIEEAVRQVIQPGQPCVRELSQLVKLPQATLADIARAKDACRRSDARR